ncbi:MAG: HYR domain-containing protein, partial [Saprospiraceae bacterium]|nr:HYR domain-containing protein [Saprospiraceae bacterium]
MKQIVNSIIKISTLLILSISISVAQTFPGNTINTAGNSTIPSVGTGGCAAAPQTTGGTIFQCNVAGLVNTQCLRLSRIQVNFTHTFTADIDMYLVSPTGQILELSTDNGGAGDNYINTIFCDTALSNITAGVAPFTGLFRPEGTLTASICGTTITPTVPNITSFTTSNGTWQLVIKDDIGADIGTMSAWSLTFEAIADIETNNNPNILPLAPGTCVPAGGIACISPVGTVCPVPTAPISIRYALNNRPATLQGYTVCGTSGVSLPAAGEYRIYWISIVGCVTDTASSLVTVQDLEPPTFNPSCPKGNLVSLNAGPGECEVSWDAPQFMAMDNCPASSFGGANSRSVGCNLGANNFLTSVGNNNGLMFDIMNTSSRALAVTAVWMSPQTANGNVYRVYATTAAGSFLPNVNNPSAWTLISGDSTRVGQTAFPPNPARFLERMGMATATITSRVSCTGMQIFDTAVTPKLILQPGETKGMALYGMNGASFYYVNGIAPCNNTPQGDANLKMVLNSGRIQFNAAANGVFAPQGFFSIRMFNGDLEYVFGQNMIIPEQYCGQPYAPGCFFPIGCTRLCYRATDAAGNVATCEFNVCVNAFPNPINSLACHDDVQLSLDDQCQITLDPDMFLSGGPYKCYNAYRVQARLWQTTGTGGLIDRNLTLSGVQLNGNDIGRDFRITVIDTATGNSCWSHATVEDKFAPSLTCPPNITVSCAAGISPAVTGVPIVVENCGGVSLTFRDDASKGNCALGYSWRMVRTWTAVDGSGNRATCTQLITVGIGDIFDVTVPRNYDNLDAPMLNCNEKIDRNKDVSPHMADFPECVDGYLLDSAFWRANPNAPNIYPNRRLPRVLGWNCIEDPADPKFRHPAPESFFYPPHRQWSPQNPLCWGPDRHIMWQGTGRPGGVDCFNFSVTCEDIVFNLATPGCDAGPVGCYKLLRKWTVLDWCTGTLGGHNQIIKVGDIEGPQVLYPDSARINMESYSCSGRWEVPPAWLIDNCSNEIHYSVEVQQGTILGNETSGYVVINMPEGIQIGYIVATDCCGNITKKRVVLNVVDRVPPTAVCRTSTVVGINGNQSPGENVARVCAEAFDEGSYDNCSPHVWFKVIRMAELLG